MNGLFSYCQFVKKLQYALINVVKCGHFEYFILKDDIYITLHLPIVANKYVEELIFHYLNGKEKYKYICSHCNKITVVEKLLKQYLMERYCTLI